MAWVAAWVWNLPIGLLLYLLLLFPDGRPPSRRLLPVAWLSAALTAVGAVSGGDHAGSY
jgi:two-component system NarL family sensor kinase